jgi:hypothetical protein
VQWERAVADGEVGRGERRRAADQRTRQLIPARSIPRGDGHALSRYWSKSATASRSFSRSKGSYAADPLLPDGRDERLIRVRVGRGDAEGRDE